MAAPSTSIPPPPEQTGLWGRRRRRNGRRRGSSCRRQVQGQGRANLGIRTRTAPVSGGAGSIASWYSQCHMLLDQDRAGGSRGAQDQHACQRAGTSETRSPGRDTAPSNIVRSPSISRSSHRSPLPPTTPAEALARAQLLLDYPPTADKIDEWRATIQSLIGFANGDIPWQPSTSQLRQDCQARADGDKKPVGVQLSCTLRPEGQDRRLAGSTSTATPPHHQIHELVVISAKFFTNDSKKTLVLASSAEEKRGVNWTSVLGPLSTCTRQGNQATCHTR